jgi:hypothetical protein
MRNQIAAAERMGVRAATINSDNQSDGTEVEAKLSRNTIDILLISPERLANQRFSTQVLPRIAAQISLLVVDEAHCISDWGHDFRPHYRLIERSVRSLPANMRFLATTATENGRVMEDLRLALGPNLEISRGDLNRNSLFLQTIRLPSQTSFPKEKDWVFASPLAVGKLPYCPDAVLKRHLWPAAQRAGITKRIGWHSFRRTLATLLQFSGATLKTTQELMRHASPGITMGIYAKAVTADKRQAQDTVAAMFVGNSNQSVATSGEA